MVRVVYMMGPEEEIWPNPRELLGLMLEVQYWKAHARVWVVGGPGVP